LGFLTAILTTTVAVATGATTHPLAALLPLVAVVLAIAAVSTPAATVATAAVSWTLHAGFVLGRHGDLAFTPPSIRDAAVLGAAALLAVLGTTLARTLLAPSRTTLVAIPVPRIGSAPSPNPAAHA
jgi:hypothetical protein